MAVQLVLPLCEINAGNSVIQMRHSVAMPMTLALEAAGKSIGLSDPNPRVGCVIVDSDGRTVGIGYTQPPGGPHAEIVALQDAVSRGLPTQGTTAYVTLEPCSHFGRTGPCCDALIAAGVIHVIASIADPNPLVAGRGFEKLKASGIAVDVGMGADSSYELNIGFFHRMTSGLPWVRMKVASSLDGRTALGNGVSQWISGEESRIDGHSWRARASAVLTGIGTVLHDRPRLDVRHVPTTCQPALVIVDSHLKTPLDAPCISSNRQVYIYYANENKEKIAHLHALGATTVYMPDSCGKVHLKGMLMDLGKREINELHVEAGQELNGAFLRNELVNELIIYLAPKLLGCGRSIASIGPFSELSESIKLKYKSVTQIGQDIRIQALVI